jgi:3-deoxy-7-phosphoheptulonate synthase
MARAALVAGAHGLMVEMHPEPDKALCDGAQSLDPQMFSRLMQELRKVEAFLAELDLRESV